MLRIRNAGGFPVAAALLLTSAGLSEASELNEIENVLLGEWTNEFQMPPFGAIPDSDYVPAFEQAARVQNQLIADILAQDAAPTFDNTILPYERSRDLLYRVLRAFLPVSQAAKSEGIVAASKAIYPAFAAHEEAIFLNSDLFERVSHVFAHRNDLGLASDQVRLVELVHQEFVKSGVGVPESNKPTLEVNAARIAEAGREFSERIAAETNQYELLIEDIADLAGIPSDVVAAARARAIEQGHECECWSFDLQPSNVDAFLKYSPNREQRKRLYQSYMAVGSSDNDWNTAGLVNEILSLRAKRAQILGYDSFAAYETSFAMAETPERAEGLMQDVYKTALSAAMSDLKLLRDSMAAEGVSGDVEAWDWAYYAEKVRGSRFQFSEEDLRPYLSLENVRAGAFDMANRLFGLCFIERDDLPRWHPDQLVFEVQNKDGEHVGVLMHDYYSRDNKRNGVWTDEVRVAEQRDSRVHAISANTFRFTKPVGGGPTLLDLAEAETLFHEFGHSLNTLLSTQRYVRLSGFNYLPRDGVEYPSQVAEYWFSEPAFLVTFAKHYETGKPIPKELLNRMSAASRFNTAHQKAGVAASSILDLRLHGVSGNVAIDAGEIQVRLEKELSLPAAIGFRYRYTQFRHIINEGYASAYYGYLWSDVVATDAFGAFEENGLFDAKTAAAFQKYVFAAGASAPQLVMFEAFRGRVPNPDALMERLKAVD